MLHAIASDESDQTLQITIFYVQRSMFDIKYTLDSYMYEWSAWAFADAMHKREPNIVEKR